MPETPPNPRQDFVKEVLKRGGQLVGSATFDSKPVYLLMEKGAKLLPGPGAKAGDFKGGVGPVSLDLSAVSPVDKLKTQRALVQKRIQENDDLVKEAAALEKRLAGFPDLDDLSSLVAPPQKQLRVLPLYCLKLHLTHH